MLRILRIALTVAAAGASAAADTILVEAESFTDPGGWKTDTQFIDTMGSPYLLAHGLGRPVDDARTTVSVPKSGTYHVFVRTKDWVARWQAPVQPGRFQVLIDGRACPVTFGTQGAEWFWQHGGRVELAAGQVSLALHDLTGFDGRCDAVVLSTVDTPPPNDSAVLPSWRRRLLGLPEDPEERTGYDLVVVGGGYAGMGAAISAARCGCRVALIQNRPVLGGNGSSEVRVWSQGLIRRGRFPRIGEIVEEFCDHATKSPGRYDEFEDAKKEAIVRAEPNIDLFLNHHVYRVETDGTQIVSVDALHTQTNRRIRFRGRLFADCTGHGTVGFLAGADWDMTPKGRMGMSNMWAWDEGKEPVAFPKTPWALDLDMEDFPYPRDHHGQWFWESGFDKDPIAEAEAIRDWNLRAVFGAFQAMKNRGGAARHRNAFLTWVAWIGGPRESRRLLGDVVLTQEDIVSKRDFPDGCVPSTWTIDLHYPRQQYAKTYPDNPFISIARHDRRIDRLYGYPVPYRCFYSRNIDNLFMAGRCISVTHEALGTTRVMKTCGMMGEVVGKAASVCVRHHCLPRQVHTDHWEELETLLQLPGRAFRATVEDDFTIPDDALPLAGPLGPPTGLDPRTLDGLVIDDRQAQRFGEWIESQGLTGYVGYGYLYSADSNGQVVFRFTAAAGGPHAVRISWQPHENRGSHVPVRVVTRRDDRQFRVNMKHPPEQENGFHTLGIFELHPGETVEVTVSAADAGGIAHADAVQVVRAD